MGDVTIYVSGDLDAVSRKNTGNEAEAMICMTSDHLMQPG